MPSSYTTNYKLNQWVRSDRVLMEDFNADNAKIDAAFRNHPSAELISTLTVAEENRDLIYDISHVDWNRYMMVVMFLNAASDGGFEFIADSGHETCQHLLNTGVYKSKNFLETYDVNRMILLFPVFYNGSRGTTAIGLGADLTAQHSTLTNSACVKHLNQLTTIHMRRSTMETKFLPGDTIELWGIK